MNSKRIRFHTSIGFKLSLCLILGIVLFAVAVTLITNRQSINLGNTTCGQRAIGIAKITAGNLDGDRFEDLVENGDSNSEYYQTMQKYMNHIKDQADVTYLYTLVRVDDHTYRYIIDGSDTDDEDFSPFGSEDDATSYPDDIQTAFQGEPFISKSYSADEWGYLTSAFVPIINKAGRVVGVVGCDVSLAGILQDIRTNTLILILLLCVIGLLALLLMTFMTRWLVVRPVKKMAALVNKLAKDDYTEAVDPKLCKKPDEIGLLANAVRYIRQRTIDDARAITESANRLTVSAETLKTSAHQVGTGAEEVAKSVDEVANGATDQARESDEGRTVASRLGSIVQQDLQYLKELESVYEHVVNLSKEGQTAIDTIGKTADNSDRALAEAGKSINRTRDSSEHILAASHLINAIADQTNLLALNAAIEAARAGEQGRGFAVVADEIRKLAEQSAESVSEIDSTVSELIDSTKSAVQIMNTVRESFAEQQKSIETGKTKYGDIYEAIAHINNTVGKLNSSSEEMDKGRTRLEEVLTHLASIAEENAAVTEQSAASMQEQTASVQEITAQCDRLADMSRELLQFAKRYKFE